MAAAASRELGAKLDALQRSLPQQVWAALSLWDSADALGEKGLRGCFQGIRMLTGRRVEGGQSISVISMPRAGAITVHANYLGVHLGSGRGEKSLLGQHLDYCSAPTCWSSHARKRGLGEGFRGVRRRFRGSGEGFGGSGEGFGGQEKVLRQTRHTGQQGRVFNPDYQMPHVPTHKPSEGKLEIGCLCTGGCGRHPCTPVSPRSSTAPGSSAGRARPIHNVLASC